MSSQLPSKRSRRRWFPDFSGYDPEQKQNPRRNRTKLRRRVLYQDPSLDVHFGASNIEGKTFDGNSSFKKPAEEIPKGFETGDTADGVLPSSASLSVNNAEKGTLSLEVEQCQLR